MQQNSNPILTGALALELLEKSKTQKPTARGTRFRYSSSFGCERAQAYAALGAEITEPMDESGAWATGIGTILHELTQAEITKRYPSARHEVTSQTGDVSGSCDSLIDVNDVGTNYGGTHVLWEFKTMGGYGFDTQVGWNRMRSIFKPQGAQGPKKGHIAQAGMNALGIEREALVKFNKWCDGAVAGPGFSAAGGPEKIRIETIIMGAVTFEALSKQKARNMGVLGLNRFVAEFEIPREEWEPLARYELSIMEDIGEKLNHGILPDRVGRDDSGGFTDLRPLGSDWQCEYCSYRSTCLDDGDGEIMVENSVAIRSSSGEA